MRFKPFHNKILSYLWQVALKHLESSNVEQSNVFVIYGMDMRWFMLFWFEEHFYHNSIESYYLRHIAVVLYCRETFHFCWTKIRTFRETCKLFFPFFFV